MATNRGHGAGRFGSRQGLRFGARITARFGPQARHAIACAALFAAAAGAAAGDIIVFPRNMAVTVEFPAALKVSGAEVALQGATLKVKRSDGKICTLTATFALVGDTGVVIGRGNSLKCPESDFDKQVKGQFIDPKSGTGAFRGYCVKRDHAGSGDDFAANPCTAAEVPAHTRALFLFKREVVL